MNDYLNKDEIDNLKKITYEKFIEYVNNINKEIVKELIVFKLEYEWKYYIEDHSEQLVKGNEERVIYDIVIQCMMFSNWISENTNEQLRYLKVLEKRVK